MADVSHLNNHPDDSLPWAEDLKHAVLKIQQHVMQENWAEAIKGHVWVIEQGWGWGLRNEGGIMTLWKQAPKDALENLLRQIPIERVRDLEFWILGWDTQDEWNYYETIQKYGAFGGKDSCLHWTRRSINGAIKKNFYKQLVEKNWIDIKWLIHKDNHYEESFLNQLMIQFLWGWDDSHNNKKSKFDKEKWAWISWFRRYLGDVVWEEHWNWSLNEYEIRRKKSVQGWRVWWSKRQQRELKKYLNTKSTPTGVDKEKDEGQNQKTKRL